MKSLLRALAAASAQGFASMLDILPAKKLVNDSYTHDLMKLVDVAD
jgi:hypothetical protein